MPARAAVFVFSDGLRPRFRRGGRGGRLRRFPVWKQTLLRRQAELRGGGSGIRAAADDDETLDFFSDNSSNSETVAAAKAEPAPAAKPAPAATVAPAASDADVDVEAMEINLDMATSFIVMGKAEKARSWLDEVLESGSESQKVRARSMLAQLDK